jgi:hypothetical protein
MNRSPARPAPPARDARCGRRDGREPASPALSKGLRLALAWIPIALLVGCQDVAPREIPRRHPITVAGESLATIALVTYAGSVDPGAVSKGTLCPRSDPVLSAQFFSAPEEILAEELRRAGYPVTEVPSSDVSDLASAYPVRIAVSFVGESHCKTRVPLFGPRKAEDCTVRVRLTLTGGGPEAAERAFERMGESSVVGPVDAIQGDGPSPAWREAVRDAVRQILADPRAAALLRGRGGEAARRGAAA